MTETFEEITGKVFGPNSLESLAEENPVKHTDVVVGMLDELGLLELREVVTAAQQKLNEREIQELAAAREHIQELAGKLNISPSELLTGLSPVKPNGGKAPNQQPKTSGGYRNPENPEQTWSGKGRAPKWFHAAIDAGMSKESMRI